MAHFAKIESGLVTQVIVVNNSDILDKDGNESEAVGAQYCADLLGGTWVQTSYNGNIDAFIEPKPYPSWVLNETTCIWEAPVALPSNDRSYVWDESSQSWS